MNTLKALWSTLVDMFPFYLTLLFMWEAADIAEFAHFAYGEAVLFHGVSYTLIYWVSLGAIATMTIGLFLIRRDKLRAR